MSEHHILVIDDDGRLRILLRRFLEESGFRVTDAGNASEARKILQGIAFDLLVVDIMMPGETGLEFLADIRKDNAVPALFLTAMSDTENRIEGLEAGADDYMQKPFRDKAELIARIRTRLRRTNADVTGLLTIGDLTIDVTAHEVQRGATLIQLTRLEFDLLVALAKDPGRVFTRDALLSEVWGYRHSTDTRLVNVHVQRLRSKVEHDPEQPEIVMTVRGVGYKAGVPA